jgi:hypothetical protein
MLWSIMYLIRLCQLLNLILICLWLYCSHSLAERNWNYFSVSNILKQNLWVTNDQRVCNIEFIFELIWIEFKFVPLLLITHIAIHVHTLWVKLRYASSISATLRSRLDFTHHISCVWNRLFTLHTWTIWIKKLLILEVTAYLILFPILLIWH